MTEVRCWCICSAMQICLFRTDRTKRITSKKRGRFKNTPPFLQAIPRSDKATTTSACKLTFLPERRESLSAALLVLGQLVRLALCCELLL